MNKTFYLSSPVEYSLFAPLFKNLYKDLESSTKEEYLEPVFSEDDNFFYAEIDIPGIEEEEVNISLNKGVVSIKASSAALKEKDRKYYSAIDRSFSCSFQLPDVVNSSIDPTAVLQRGVLQLAFKKSENEMPRKILVNKK